MNRRPVLLSPPDVGEVEQAYVLAAMWSGWVAPAGSDLEAFEREVADRVGAPHAVALSSGTAALHLALLAWGVGPGDVVLTATLTFDATSYRLTTGRDERRGAHRMGPLARSQLDMVAQC